MALKRLHTPAPWLAASKPSSVAGWPVVGELGTLIADVCTMRFTNETPVPKEAEANACLIGTAPKMVDALIDAREALHFHYVEWDGEPEDAVPLQLARSKCDEAIAEALGVSVSEVRQHFSDKESQHGDA